MKVILVLIAALFAASTLASDIEGRKERIAMMASKISQEAADRKARSELILSGFNVPVNPYLPFIEDQSEALIRQKDEVAVRAMALLIVAAKAEGLEQGTVDELIKDYGLADALTPNERRFIADPDPSRHDRIQFVWRYEAAWALLWSLSYVDELAPPTSICDVAAAVTFLQERTREEFIADAELRSISDLLDANDLIYRYHWAVVDARVNGRKIPAEIDSSVVLERHYALNWLVGYMGQEWDEVSTDT
ncbi:MAG: DUF4272 domain-containing protein [Gammaproteobacteria bacterium HGW-Gammaproteobacteria-6]|nr:MAG: DUF4272 domain-containing protein [Gammaproteobacteria bacterium HGW-Gammaproteobacteria-6]